MLVAFVVPTEMQFYYIPTGPFLLDMGATEAWLTATKTVAQISEVLVLTFLLHVAIKKIGIENTNIELDEKGFVFVDKYQKTNINNIYVFWVSIR